MRFFPDDIEKLIAAGDQNGLGSESSEIAAGSILHGGVRAYWTWNQTIAWIMFRDPGFVGKVLGSEGLQFKLLISQRTQIGRPPIVASLGDARHELVECAKATNIKVLGCRSGATDVETIPPWDRCRGAISEGDGPPVLKIGNEEYSDSDLRILNHGPGIVWRDLLLPRDTIVKHWPPNGIKIAQSDVSRPAPDGTIFIDEAIERLQVRLGGISDGRAVKMVLDVLASTEVRTRLRRNETYQPKKYSLHADSWKGSYIDLEEFRNGRGGVRLNGDVYHLHRVLISEDDFNDWLNQIAPASTGGPLPMAALKGEQRPVRDVLDTSDPERSIEAVDFGTISPNLPVSREEFCKNQYQLPNMLVWAMWKYPDKRYPSREQILTDHRKEYGKIGRISESIIRELLRKIAPGRKGGAPTHRDHFGGPGGAEPGKKPG